jgi:CheY-like chemotaxis protein
MGSDVQTAFDGPTALSLLETYGPEIVLLDLGMPGMSGFEVAEQVRGRPEFDEVKLVALTGWGQDEDRRRTQEAGFDDHLVKPLTATALKQLLA